MCENRKLKLQERAEWEDEMFLNMEKDLPLENVLSLLLLFQNDWSDSK